MTQYRLDGQAIYDPDGHYVCELIAADHEHLNTLLGALAQHERIVAAKDAEIAKRDQAFDVMNRTLNAVIEERDELRAQLAAQQAAVPDAWRDLAKQAAEALHVFTGHDSGANLCHRYGENWWEPLNELRDKLRAMLAAPAAPQHGVVMPAYLQFCTLHTQQYAVGWNACLDEFARLNPSAQGEQP